MSEQVSPSFVAPMRRVLVAGGVTLCIALPAAAGLGYWAAGSPAAWGAVIGIALAMGFFGVTVALAAVTARLQPATFAVATLGGWLVKLVLLLATLAALRDADFYSRPALFTALVFGTAGSLAIETLVITRAQVPYTEPVPQPLNPR